MCIRERGQDQGLGEDGGTYIVELVSALREGGLATQMIREAHEGWAEGQGRMELQVHLGNRRALEYYGRLGMSRCKWWETVSYTHLTLPTKDSV